MKMPLCGSMIALVIPSVFLGFLSPDVNAATLADYQFATDLNATSTGTFVTASALGGTGTSRSSSSYAYQYPQSENSGYMEFTLTADSGYLLDLDQLDFAYYFPQTSGALATVSATFSLQYSLDSFATAGIGLTNPQAVYTSTSGALDATIVIGDFSSSSYSLAAIPDTSSISFRIVLTNDSALNTPAYRYAVDNLSVKGNALSIVPEPSTAAALAGVIVMGFAVWRRRSARI